MQQNLPTTCLPESCILHASAHADALCWAASVRDGNAKSSASAKSHSVLALQHLTLLNEALCPAAIKPNSGKEAMAPGWWPRLRQRSRRRPRTPTTPSPVHFKAQVVEKIFECDRWRCTTARERAATNLQCNIQWYGPMHTQGQGQVGVQRCQRSAILHKVLVISPQCESLARDKKY